MKKIFKLLVLLLFSTISLTTFAGEQGFYIGGSLGYTDSDLLSDSEEDAIDRGIAEWGAVGVTATYDDDENDLGFKFFAGYNINEYFGVEAAYVNLGDVTADASLSYLAETLTVDVEAEADGFSFAGVARYPIYDRTEVFAKVGLFVWEADADASATFGGVTASESYEDDGTDIMFGFGASYAMTTNISVRGEWERYALDDYDVDLFSVGVQYYF